MNLRGNREKWVQHLATSKFPLGPIKDVPFSFRNPLINAHFRFALAVLEVLGEINTIFQTKYGFFPNLWEYLSSLDQFLRRELWKIQHGDFTSFPCLAQIRLDNIPQFVSILKHLIMNLYVRFYAMSFSLNKVSIKDYIDYDRMRILPGAPNPDDSRCGVSQLLEVFNMRHTDVPTRLFNMFLLNGIQHEWGSFMFRALHRKDEVLARTHERPASLITRERETMELLQTPSTTNLIDAFHAIDRQGFYNILRFVVRALTIIPTSVACEQSFSFFKRTIHTNMSEQTSKIFLMARMNLFNYDFNL